jgi:hypothetical protein
MLSISMGRLFYDRGGLRDGGLQLRVFRDFRLCRLGFLGSLAGDPTDPNLKSSRAAVRAPRGRVASVPYSMVVEVLGIFVCSMLSAVDFSKAEWYLNYAYHPLTNIITMHYAYRE